MPAAGRRRAAAALAGVEPRHPDSVACRITVGDDEYERGSLARSGSRFETPIIAGNTTCGRIELGRVGEQRATEFLPDETSLVEEVAGRIARAVERRRAEEDARVEAEEEARLQAEEEAREQSERLAHAGRMSLMGEMATGIAHEVNQPLTAISTYAQACSRMIEAGMIEDRELLDVVDRIAREALRAGNIIHRLRNLVRKRASERELCDINDVVRDLVSLAEIDARLHDVELRLDLAEEMPAVRVDAVQIQQVVLNLVRNALEASHAVAGDAQTIDLVSRRVGSEVEIEVVDHGVGLTSEVGDEVFEPFYTTKRSGMGMGLSISRSIVDAHGGRLWFSRNPDGGTTFHVAIPVASGED